MDDERILALLIEPTNPMPAPVTTQEMQQDWTININAVSIPRSILTSTTWWESSLSASLGVPLQVIGHPHSNNEGYNYPIQCLFMNHDLSSPDFAQSTRGPITGGVLVARCDGLDFGNDAVFHVLTEYINDYFVAAANMILSLPEGERKESAKQKIVEKMSREAFHAHFEEFRRLEVREGGTAWKGIESPVLAKYPNVGPACGYCGKADGTLTLCSKCRVRRFCSKQCQIADWRSHKKACGVQMV